MVRATQRWSIREREPIGVRVGVHSGAVVFFHGRWISMGFCMILLTLVWEGTPKTSPKPPQFERNSEIETVGERSFWYIPGM